MPPLLAGIIYDPMVGVAVAGNLVQAFVSMKSDALGLGVSSSSRNSSATFIDQTGKPFSNRSFDMFDAIGENTELMLAFIREHNAVAIIAAVVAALLLLGALFPVMFVGIMRAIGFGATGIMKGSSVALHHVGYGVEYIFTSFLSAIRRGIGAVAQLPPAVSVTIITLVVGTITIATIVLTLSLASRGL